MVWFFMGYIKYVDRTSKYAFQENPEIKLVPVDEPNLMNDMFPVPHQNRRDATSKK